LRYIALRRGPAIQLSTLGSSALLSEGAGLTTEPCILFSCVGKMANAIEEVVDCLVKVDQRVSR